MVANIFKTFLYDLEQTWEDVSIFFSSLFDDIYSFLNRYMSKEFMIALGICVVAFLAIAIFRAIINH